jgi:hypothetical protein
MVVWLPTVTSSVANPIKEKTRIASFPGTEIGYLPSMSVTVPVEVPLMSTFTPGTGEPSASELTVPVIVLS